MEGGMTKYSPQASRFRGACGLFSIQKIFFKNPLTFIYVIAYNAV